VNAKDTRYRVSGSVKKRSRLGSLAPSNDRRVLQRVNPESVHVIKSDIYNTSPWTWLAHHITRPVAPGDSQIHSPGYQQDKPFNITRRTLARAREHWTMLSGGR